jgi:hypothetical protein
MGGSNGMTFYQILTLIGVEGLFSAIIIWVWRQVTGVRKGVQALLRAQMINDYNKWVEKGYAPIYARQNFENCWKNYHDLGVNGVMDDLHNKFLELPTDERSNDNEN